MISGMGREACDVFLSYNRDDRGSVETLAKRLKRRGFNPWLDRWNLIPGVPWQPEIETVLCDCECCAVFVGKAGVGPWQNEEMRAAIQRRVSSTANSFRVIPVLLPGAKRDHNGHLPPFLTASTWVEFAEGIDDKDAFHRLVSGIRGVRPGAAAKKAAARTEWVIVLSARFEDINKPVIDTILEHLRKLSGDSSLTIRKVERGSVIITLDGTKDGLDRIRTLAAAGELKRVADVPVSEIRDGETRSHRQVRQLLANLSALGFTKKELADRADLSPSTLSQITAGEPLALKESMWERIHNSLLAILDEKLGSIVQMAPIVALEYCHEGSVVDKAEVDVATRAVITNISLALRGDLENRTSLPEKFHGMLVRLGLQEHGLHIYQSEGTNDAERLRHEIHELEHVIGRMKDRLTAIEAKNIDRRPRKPRSHF